MQDFKLNRRSFLKATGALAGLAALSSVVGCNNNLSSASSASSGSGASSASSASSGSAKPQDDVKIVKSQCRMCHGTCGALVHVRNGRVIKVEGYEEAPTSRGTMCPKGLAAIQHQYNPRRLRYPIKRVGERGQGKWERITWEAAYEILADRMHSTEKVNWAMSSGTGRHQQDWYGIFQNVIGLRNGMGSPPLCYLPRIQVITRMFGYRIPVADYMGFKGDKNPGVVIFWGNNVTNSHADGMHGSAPMRAVNKGSKLICIDPVFTNISAKADIWLPVRPATDLALALAFLNVIVTEDLYDHEFVEKWSNLPGLVRDDNGKMLTEYDFEGKEKQEFRGPPFEVLPPELIVVWDKDKNKAVLANGPDINPAMTGSFTVDLPGQGAVQCHTAWDALVKRLADYTPALVAEMTDCEADTITEAARVIAKEAPSVIQWGVSFDQWGVNTADAVQAAMMIVALSGSLDVPGGMAMWNSLPLRKMSFPSEISERYVNPEMYRAELMPPEVSAVSAKYAICPWGGGSNMKSTIAIATGEQRCELLWVVGANPLHSRADTAETLRAIEKCEFIVVWDHYMTATAQMADLVLPVAVWTEMSRLADAHFLWGMQARIKAVEPIGECRSDEMGTLGLIKKLAETEPEYYNKQMPWNSEEEWINWRLEPMNTNWDDFKEKWLHIAEQKPYLYKETKFYLPAGRAELYLRAKMAHGEDPLPRYREQPYYTPTNTELFEKYPFYNITRRVQGYFHTEYRQLPFMREIWPEPMVEINDQKAKEMGIANGDWVVIESETGKIKLKAIVTPALAPNVICTEHDWWFPEVEEGTDPKLGGAFESNWSVVISNEDKTGFDKLNGCPILRGFFVNMYKSPDGPPKGLNPQEVYKWMPETELK